MRPFLLLLLAALAVAPMACRQATSSPPPGLGLGIDSTAMDRSVRPQDDLYRYVNGAWLDTAEIPADRPRYGSFDQLREKSERDVRAIIEDAMAGEVDDPDAEKIADLYRSYLDSTRTDALGIAPLEADLERIAAVDSAEDLARYFARNAWEFGPRPFVWYVTTDDRNSDQYALHFTQSGLGLPNRSYYFDDQFAEARAAYQVYLGDLYDLAEWPDGAPVARTVFDLERQLAEHHWTPVQNRDPEATYNKFALADFSAAHPNLHLDILLPEARISGVDSVIVSQPSYFEALNDLMAEIPLVDWTAWAQARTLNSAAGLLSQEFIAASFDFNGRTLNGQEEDRPRWKKAVQAINGTLGESVGRIYVARHFTPEAKARMDGMIRNLQEAMRQSITELEWMSEETKEQALNKLSTYVFKIGYPDEWEDYSDLEIRPDDLFGNVQRASLWGYNDMIGDLGQPVDRGEWGMTPQTVNAYYNPAFNEIVFPAAILQPPFFNVEADDAVNYGAIGGVIGHEFSHGFDDSGSQYDAEGNLRSWWTDTDLEEFERLTGMLVEQYNGYAPFEDARVNGELTLGENIGDLSGLTMAHRAYRLSLGEEEAPVIEGFTGDQRFFMGWAQVWRIKHRDAFLRQLLQVDPHAPGQYRAVGPLPHIPAFYAAFNLEPGDGMYVAPEERIKLW
ncbi:MAG: M13 family metallopeptidase [Rhodothermaceae bacterium]|nr:M13 family metallopeptidase [Rhodothermaceae bacterium]